MVEMFTLFPHESARVMQRGIELGIVCSVVLVAHCIYLVNEHWTSDRYPDVVLRAICIARILCALPRPYFWFRTRKLFVEARLEPTPQLVTRRLLDIYAHPFGIERGLLLFYYGWLGIITVMVCLMQLDSENSAFTQKLWAHCLMNFVSIVLHRVLCVAMFYYLMKSDFKRGIPLEVLEKYSKRVQFRKALGTGNSSSQQSMVADAECSICFGVYTEGEELRQLRCGHQFHQRCVDVWLLRHQNRCPLCLLLVGPQR